MTSIDRQCARSEKLMASDRLPVRFTKGAKKAYVRFQEFYGPEDGKRIFITKALEQGRGLTVDEKINDVYKTGARLGRQGVRIVQR